MAGQAVPVRVQSALVRPPLGSGSPLWPPAPAVSELVTHQLGVHERSEGRVCLRTDPPSQPGPGQEPSPGLPGHISLCSPCRAAVQRVVTAMNQMDQKKHEKFANQFNYALS